MSRQDPLSSPTGALKVLGKRHNHPTVDLTPNKDRTGLHLHLRPEDDEPAPEAPVVAEPRSRSQSPSVRSRRTLVAARSTSASPVPAPNTHIEGSPRLSRSTLDASFSLSSTSSPRASDSGSDSKDRTRSRPNSISSSASLPASPLVKPIDSSIHGIRELSPSRESDRLSRLVAAFRAKHAACIIQRAFRRHYRRELERETKYWLVWNELDVREEYNLIQSSLLFHRLESAYRLHGHTVTDRALNLNNAMKSLSIDWNQTDESVPSEPSANADFEMDINYQIDAARASSVSSLSGEELVPQGQKYTLPQLTEPITLDYIVALLNYFTQDNIDVLPPVSDFMRILAGARRLMLEEPNVVRFNEDCANIVVVGDLHGQLDDLLTVLDQVGMPSFPNNILVFNGDFVDRGRNSVEVFMILAALKCWQPRAVQLNRGNHEARDINCRDGFEAECRRKYPPVVFDACQQVFASMPLMCVLWDKALVVHGFIWPETYTMSDVENIDRFHEQPPVESLMELVMWSDPSNVLGINPNPRGAGLTLGPDVTDRFVQATNLMLIIRSHECVRDGFEHTHSHHVLTLFSASNYCGVVRNAGAYMKIPKDGNYQIVQFYAVMKSQLHFSAEKAASNFVASQSAPSSDSEISEITANSKLNGTLTTASQSQSISGRLHRICPGLHQQNMVMESAIVTELSKYISSNRLKLLEAFQQRRQAIQSADYESNVLSLTDWQECLRVVLRLNVDFIQFAAQLGVVELPSGLVDFESFASKYRPVHIELLGFSDDDESDTDSIVEQPMEQPTPFAFPERSAFLIAVMGMNTNDEPASEPLSDICSSVSIEQTSVSSPIASSSDATGNLKQSPKSSVFDQLAEFMFQSRTELVALFTQGGREHVTFEEFADALKSLSHVQNQLGGLNTRIIRRVFDRIDADRDGKINIRDFSEGFQLHDLSLNYQTSSNPTSPLASSSLGFLQKPSDGAVSVSSVASESSL